MGYSIHELERAREQIRDHFEHQSIVAIDTLVRAKDEERPRPEFHLRTTGTYLGAYLTGERLVVMVKWDDLLVDDAIREDAFPAVSRVVRSRLAQVVPDIQPEHLRVQLWDEAQQFFANDDDLP